MTTPPPEAAAVAAPPATAAVLGTLPDGVVLTPLVPHADERGVFCEVHRAEWDTGVAPLQWNVVRSEPGVLRGVHVHRRHGDYLTLAAGRMVLGLVDLRGGVVGAAASVELGPEAPVGVTIPPGVAHGFWFPEPSIHVYAVSHYFDRADELGCRWDDPDLGIPWDAAPTLLSERDQRLGSLGALLAELAAPR